MNMKSKGRRRLLSALVLGLLVAGCIVSGQFIVVIDWGGFASTADHLTTRKVDVTTNPTWIDHKDDIQDIIDVKFKVEISNLESDSAKGEVYVSADSLGTVPLVRSNATRILHGISIGPAKTRLIGFDESVSYRENLDELLLLVKEGKFYLYGIAENSPFSIEIKTGGQLLVTFSAGK
jgi:hypothetical protein